MKKVLVLCAAMLLVGASLASAAGVNLAWGNGCWAENPVSAKTFACDVNTGNAQMTGSFALAADQPTFVGSVIVLDIQFDGVTTVPAWWDFFNATSCRQTSLSVSSDFSTAPQTSCTDMWFGGGGGGVAAYQTEVFPPPQGPLPDGRARLKWAWAIPDPTSPLTAGTEYYVFRVTINNVKTTGAGLCDGCATPATIVLNEVLAAPQTGLPEIVTAEGTNRCIKWQASTVDCAAVPNRSRTWGQVKSLYR